MADINENSLAVVESTTEDQESTRQELDSNSQSQAPILTIPDSDSSLLSSSSSELSSSVHKSGSFFSCTSLLDNAISLQIQEKIMKSMNGRNCNW